jgi:ABC-type nitrate/sulfonate/bicarbonate transport system substrate-binding protein
MILFGLLLSILLLPTSAAFGAESIKPVRMITRALGDSIVIYEIGVKLGFYAEEGIKLETILAKVSTGTQAVLGDSADYVNHGSIVPAILRGVPMRVLLVDTDKPTAYIVTSPNIVSFKDLIGKTIAIEDFNGANALMVRDTLVANGIPLHSVSLRVLGPPPFRLQGLLSGAVDAAPLNFLQSRQAQQQGFRILAYTGDFTSDIQVTAATATKKIQASPNEVYKFVKATLKAQLFFFENPNDEAFKIYAEVNKLPDPIQARDVYNARLKRSSELVRIGRVSDETVMQTIERVREQLKLAGTPLKTERPIRTDELVDFSFAKRAYDEIKNEGWDKKKHSYRYVRSK